MHWSSRIFRKYSPQAIVPIDSAIAEPFILRCLAKACAHPPSHDTLALDPFLFATCETSTALRAQHPHTVTDDVLKDVLVPMLYYKCNVEVLDRVMTRLDSRYYDRSEGMVQWGFMVFWTSVKGALEYRPEQVPEQVPEPVPDDG